VDGLGLDSLALTELAVALIEEYPESDYVRSVDRDWGATSAGQLFQESVRPRRRVAQ
jgi:hypothetical protein